MIAYMALYLHLRIGTKYVVFLTNAIPHAGHDWLINVI